MTVPRLSFQDGLRSEADLGKIASSLNELASSRFVVVADQSALRCKGVNQLVVNLGAPQITDTGVTESRIVCHFTRTAWRQVAERLRIPLAYLDRLVSMENTLGPLLACQSISDLSTADERRALYRFIRTDEGYVLRAILSDKYQAIDNDAALAAILTGLAANDINLGDCEVTGDVTPDRLRLRIAVPQIALAVPELLGDYRMPFTLRPGRNMHAVAEPGETPPVLWAGIEIANSETGQGAFSIAPRAVIQVCRNGLTKAVDFRRAHLGATLEDGAIDWSATTQHHAMALISSQVSDAVATYCSPGYLQQTVDEMRAAKAVTVESTPNAVEVVQQRFGLTETERTNVFELFAASGDRSVLGLGNAVTAAAQLALDGDRQSELETMFWDIVGAPSEFAGAPL
jgi:hypothetical protein